MQREEQSSISHDILGSTTSSQDSGNKTVWNMKSHIKLKSCESYRKILTKYWRVLEGTEMYLKIEEITGRY